MKKVKKRALSHPGSPQKENEKNKQTKQQEKTKIKSKNKNETREKYLDLAKELKEPWNIEVTVIPIVIGALGMILKGFVTGTGRLRNRRTSREHPNYSIV